MSQSVDLSSSNPNVLKTPSTHKSDGHTFSFSFTTSAVDSDTPVTISATCKGVTKACSELVKAAALLSAAPASQTVTAGTWAKVTVRLNGPCGPSGGTVSFVSSDPATLYVPKSAAFPAGQISASFGVLAVNPSSSPVQITVGYRGQTYSFNVQVQ